MTKRSDRKNQELKQRYAQSVARQQEDLLRMIESLPKSSLPAEYSDDTLSDQLEQWQVSQGLREKPEREGLSIGNKLKLYNAGTEAMSRGEYNPNTVWTDDGIPWQPGQIPGTWVPAKANLKDLGDFEREEREAKDWQRASGSLWANYKVLFPQDDAATVQAAIKALQAGGMSLADLNAIADDPIGRPTAFQRIHAAVDQINYQGGTGGYEAEEEDDTAYVMGGSVARGTSTQQPEWRQGYAAGMPERTSHQGHPAGSLSAGIVAMQKKMGLRD